ncbi:aldo/keto reductase [Gregarina niphandrodes]|uniref:Aldo/keto reductase n=1 Tax=Gregarina niphandrodes TaxID=110365 RepID=A0A023B0X2_GRENI|nr:aldo/keto reductase [Gregarina niphandrodes]EZG46114.1 aldo/keto reductase [Gregarina niphandrodes]|eukprot:XP_011132370.1 aldo/keto reductase [Gregarina niphandrodes]
MVVVCKELSNGVLFPAVNLGTWQLQASDAGEVFSASFASGCRGLDGARYYTNEEELGPVLNQYCEGAGADGRVDLKKFGSMNTDHVPARFKVVTDDEYNANFVLPHGKPSDDRRIFVTTKIWPSDFDSEEKIRSSVEAHLKAYKRDQTDLILLHWPGPHCNLPNFTEEQMKDPKNAETRLGAWKVLEKLYREKKTRAIGVSNFMPQHLTPLIEDIKKRAADITAPSVPVMCNQVEGSPWIQGFRDIVEVCDNNNIAISVYRPIGGRRRPEKGPIVAEIAAKYKKPEGNVLIRWALQKGFVVLPKTSKPDRARSNMDLFSFQIEDQDMKTLDGLFMSKSDPTQDPYAIA